MAVNPRRLTRIRTWALFAVLISGALIDVARGSDLVECEPQRVTDDGHHWAYRIIDGRECWYPGRPGKPKNELYWVRGTTPSARQTVGQPGTETVPSEPPSRLVAAPPERPEIAEAMPAEWRATAADQLLAFTCCWPELEKPALLPQPTLKGGEPPAWPLALLPLGLYPLVVDCQANTRITGCSCQRCWSKTDKLPSGSQWSVVSAPDQRMIDAPP